MPLRGLGLDLVDLERFRKAAARPGFLDQLLGPQEHAARTGGDAELQQAALCFAYKEAVLKALGTGAWQEGTLFTDLEALFPAGVAGPVQLCLRGAALRRFHEGGGGRLEGRHRIAPDGRVEACCLWLVG